MEFSCGNVTVPCDIAVAQALCVEYTNFQKSEDMRFGVMYSAAVKAAKEVFDASAPPSPPKPTIRDGILCEIAQYYDLVNKVRNKFILKVNELLPLTEVYNIDNHSLRELVLTIHHESQLVIDAANDFKAVVSSLSDEDLQIEKNHYDTYSGGHDSDYQTTYCALINTSRKIQNHEWLFMNISWISKQIDKARSL